tara:strand:- start:151 stop:441 length:291 start_codon:yes stop_codon:yes gene_type:complete
LEVYETYNAFLRDLHSKTQAESAEDLGARFEEVANERTALLNTSEGESLSIDDLSEIYIQVMGEYRERQNLSRNLKSSTGEINDYLEVRRPFGAAQ